MVAIDPGLYPSRADENDAAAGAAAPLSGQGPGSGQRIGSPLHREELLCVLVLLARTVTQAMALSSGCMAYLPDIDPLYASSLQGMQASPNTFSLLPSLERGACAAETAMHPALA